MRLTSICILGVSAAVGMLMSPSALAQFDITQPGDPITLINGFNDGDGNFGPPPAAEGVEHVIDNLGNKYLNFLDVASGFQVTPSYGASVVTGLRFWTANDGVERDPASFQLEGSFNGSPYVLIANMALNLPAARNPGSGAALTGTAYQEVSFANTQAYTSYRLIFPTLKDAAKANSMQIAEVEFLVPEPSVLSLLALAGGTAAWLRRQRKNS